MGNVLSDGLSNNVIKQKLSVKNSRDVISIITFVDLVVIVPSISLFLTFNFKALTSFGLPFLAIVLAFLLYLPLAILSASFLFSKRDVESTSSAAETRILPLILFLLVTFSMLGIYIPSIEKLTLIVPSFGSLNVAGFTIVVLNLILVMKNITNIMKE